MAFCTNCGKQLPDNAKFCTGCGAKITPKPAPEAPHHPDSADSPCEYRDGDTMPTTAGFEQPQQGSYQAPQQGSYQAPQQDYQTPVQLRQKAPKASAKPMNKKTLIIIGGAVLAVILVVVLIAVLGGKGGEASTDPNAGVYNAVTAEMWGVEMNVADIWSGGFSIELKDGGKCRLNIDGNSSSGKWTLEDGALKVSGGGLDCSGTLENGVMTLENVLNMGVTLKLEREGGAAVNNGEQSDPANGGEHVTDGSGMDNATSEIQAKWNGTWYGVLNVIDATGDFASISYGNYDAYMLVNVDTDGKGSFEVYIAGSDEAFAIAQCEAKESGLYAISGTIAGGIEMNAYNWMFLPMPDYPDQYCMGDDIDVNGSLFSFTMFMKQWGASWEKEAANGALIPPSLDAYNASIANDEMPPIGFAP